MSYKILSSNVLESKRSQQNSYYKVLIAQGCFSESWLSVSVIHIYNPHAILMRWYDHISSFYYWMDESEDGWTFYSHMTKYIVIGCIYCRCCTFLEIRLGTLTALYGTWGMVHGVIDTCETWHLFKIWLIDYFYFCKNIRRPGKHEPLV